MKILLINPNISESVTVADFGDPGMPALREAVPVPVVDGVSSAVRQAETLAALRTRRPEAGGYAPPPIKPNQGLPAPIERLLRGG